MSAWQSTRVRLLSDDPDLAHDEAALSALLGAEAGGVEDILARLLRAAQHASDMADAATERMSQIKARADRYKRRSDQFRATAFAIMQAIERRSVELPELTATIRSGTQFAIITDETVLADEYVRVERRPDKAKILADLKVGVVIEGAELTNGIPSLAIRSK